MAEGNKTKLLYIVVVDDDEQNDGNNIKTKKERKGNESFRYAHSILQSALQLMGCKSRHAFKISKRVFEIMASQSSRDAPARVGGSVIGASNAGLQELLYAGNIEAKGSPNTAFVPVNDGDSKNLSSETYKRRTTVFVCRAKFLDVVCDALAQYKYVGPHQREDLILACRIREKKESMTVLLSGTSGCGKSTLSSLLGSRLGITTVISTDSIRHMMRGFVDEKDSPLLWASTYHAGECLDPVAVSEAKARRKARKTAGMSHASSKDKLSDSVVNEKTDGQKPEMPSTATEVISAKQMAIEGFRAQSEMVIESLHRLITSWEERKESVIVEGVHLSLNFVMGLMKNHPSIIPFMIYITDEDKHLERFAVRAKYMTLDPAKNKYVKYIKNIRRIQEYLCNRADKHLVPKINNTNVDKSVTTIHATLFSCLRKREAGEPLYDPNTNTVGTIYEEYRNQCAADSLSSKGMFQLIQRKGSSRKLMALVNDDGSVAKAWPVSSTDKNGKCIDSGVAVPMYGPLQIDKAEAVNLQFGHFGLSAWPSDTGGTSHASSFDDTRTDWLGSDTGSRCYSSCCSSPRVSDDPAKLPKEEHLVAGSEEEVDDPLEIDSDEDLSDGHKRTHEEIGGSVDEGSANSDEEYDDLAIQDDHEKGYWSDKDEEFRERLLPSSGHLAAFLKNNKREDKYPPTLDMFLRSQSGPFCDKHEKKLSCPDYSRMRKRSLSTPSSGKHGAFTDRITPSTPER